MAFRLPPLSSLRVFEAAARHNSFRKAADELNLTASAVSHGIQTLENWLGVELFYRETRGLRLTSAGEVYAPLVNQALSVLAKATDQLPGRKATGTLSVSSAPTFANKILLPRLGKFIAQFPDIRVTIDTSQGLVDLTLDDFDIAIRYASTKKPAANWTLLAMETLFPVCSPDLKEKFGVASGHEPPVASAVDPRHVGLGRLASMVSGERHRGPGVDRQRAQRRYDSDGIRCGRARPRCRIGTVAAGRRRYRERPSGAVGRSDDPKRQRLLAGHRGNGVSEAGSQTVPALAFVRARRRDRASQASAFGLAHRARPRPIADGLFTPPALRQRAKPAARRSAC